MSDTENAYRAVRSIAERGTVNDLGELAELRDEIDARIAEVVEQQRSQQQTPWATIGRVLGVSKQAAQQRYGG
jgi:hypothetical protein